MTGRDGRKTLGFYRLIQLVASCPSLLVLKYKEIFSFSASDLCFSATGMTGRDGRKTLGFYRLIQLVASCPSLLVLKYKEIFSFSASDLCFSETVTIGCAGRNFVILRSLSAFLERLLCLPLLSDDECVSTFAWWVSEPYRELGVTNFRGCTTIVLL